jgi:hypothetical protein
MFPKVEKSDLDTVALGRRMKERKAELEAEAAAIRPTVQPKMSAMERVAGFLRG